MVLKPILLSQMNSTDDKPLVVREVPMLRDVIAAVRESGSKRIGLVPTMGALHAGHLSLVDASLRECDYTVVTIFVNPTQFSPSEDLDKYPRTFESDVAALAEREVDLVFAPSNDEMYPADFETTIDVGRVAKTLEGKHRPTHFQGVATVVLKLFNLVRADFAYFGHKDYQQAVVIRRMVADLNVPIEVRIEPTVREASGIALSSRNAYLDPQQRESGLAISRALRNAKEMVEEGETNAPTVEFRIREVLEAEDELEIDYVALVAEGTVTPVERIEGPTVALVAARVGTTRLIDNMVLRPQ